MQSSSRDGFTIPAMGSKASWRQIYSWISAVVGNLDSIHLLLRQTLECLAITYETEGILIAGLEYGEAGNPQAFGTVDTWAELEELGESIVPDEDLPESASDTIRGYWLRSHPPWLRDQCRLPNRVQLPTGELVVPIISQTMPHPLVDSLPRKTLQLVLKLRRSPARVPLHALRLTTEEATPAIQGWEEEELESLDIVCSQLGLAYNALYWRDRLEQSRLQLALIGRIARLLNSDINPDEMVGQILAELGQGLQCDRCLLLDLRHDPVSILTLWDHPQRTLSPFSVEPLDRLIWQDAMDMFLQGGASYLQIEQTESDPELLQSWLADIQAASVLVLPLFIQAEFFGAVVLLSYAHTRTYQLDELQTVRQVADQVRSPLPLPSTTRVFGISKKPCGCRQNPPPRRLCAMS
ncbi:MAG: GAF domain-containing protein [Leptolyngbyaceae cyanobacterium SL_7_1]|nr:GAF domain-containing protein [Leptolyngbyaceae cyanobacterium SL_7_1]